MQAEASMIPRYSRPEMAAIWTDERRLALWLEVELQVAEAMAAQGRIPPEVAARLRHAFENQAARLIDPVRIAEIERATRHDVIAFLSHLEEVIGADARYLHLGLTSSDLLDTTFALQLREASDLLLAGIDRVLAALKRRALEHRWTICIGRSHGIHAEPTTFGLKLAGFYAEFARDRRRLEQARAEIATCAISGAVGTFANVDPQIESAGRGRARPDAGADLDPGDPARPACGVLRHARRDRLRHRADRDRDPPSAAYRGRRGRRIVRRRPEGQLGDAAQAQPGAEREPDRPCPPGARCRDPGARERGAVARARHRAFLGRAGDRPGHDDRARFRAASAGRR